MDPLPAPEELVAMPEAALLVHIAASGIDATISRLHRDDMAETLARLIPVYSVGEDGRPLRSLAWPDLQGGIFAHGGRIVRFRDARASIGGLAVTRMGLKAAIAALKDARAPRL
ncbi:MAG TPA: hypothetical protein VM489_05935 [Burkholderiales bacterium]|nr:hypothetical protein [Burkholderiales bacterium]